jgi:hypothetical protein
MDSLLEVEDSCVYCSKYLSNLNDFNKRMHMNTCKVRKLVETSSFANGSNGSASTTASAANDNSHHQHQQEQQMEDEYLMIGDSCSYCFKSFKDFKSDFNKRVHIRCCKIKKQTFDHKIKLNASVNNTGILTTAAQANPNTNNNSNNNGGNNMNQNQQQQQQQGNFATMLTENCLFCAKSLSNLNGFNKRMHIDHCKIRKSIEGVPLTQRAKSSPGGKKPGDLGIELGNECLYCGKSFARLSQFNRKLHFEHCKLKKRKIDAIINNSLSNGQENNMNNSGSQSQNHPMITQVVGNGLGLQQQQQHQQQQQQQMSNMVGKLPNMSIKFDNMDGHHLMMNSSLPSMHQQQQQQQQQHQQQQHHHQQPNHMTHAHHNGNIMLNMSHGGNQMNGHGAMNITMPTVFDLGDMCVFCSRSLSNLSNFNKRIHIEQCKVKQSKKGTGGGAGGMKLNGQVTNMMTTSAPSSNGSSSIISVSSNKPPAKKRAKTDKNGINNNNNNNNLCGTLMAIEMANSLGNSNNNLNVNGNMNGLMNGSIALNLNGVLAATLGSNNNNNVNGNHQQFESLTSNINLSGLDTSALHHVSLNNNGQNNGLLTNGNHIQIPLDGNNRIFI